MEKYTNEAFLASYISKKFMSSRAKPSETISHKTTSTDGKRMFTDSFDHFVLPESGLHIYYPEYGNKKIISAKELTAEQCYYISDYFKESPIPLPLCLFCDEVLDYRMTLPAGSSNLQISYLLDTPSRSSDPIRQYIQLYDGYDRYSSNKPVDPKISAEPGTLLEEFVKNAGIHLAKRPELLAQLEAEAAELAKKLDIEREKSRKVSVIEKNPELSDERNLAQAYLNDLQSGKIAIKDDGKELSASNVYYLLDDKVYQVYEQSGDYGKDHRKYYATFDEISPRKLADPTYIDNHRFLTVSLDENGDRKTVSCRGSHYEEISETTIGSSEPVITTKKGCAYRPQLSVEELLPTIEDAEAILQFFYKEKSKDSRPSTVPYPNRRKAQALIDAANPFKKTKEDPEKGE